MNRANTRSGRAAKFGPAKLLALALGLWLRPDAADAHVLLEDDESSGDPILNLMGYGHTTQELLRIEDDEQDEANEPSFIVPLPIVVGQRELAPINAHVTQTRLLGLNPTELAAVLDGHLSAEAIDGLRAIGVTEVRPGVLESVGVTVSFDPSLLVIRVSGPPADQRTQSIDVGGAAGERQPTVRPAFIAAGVTTNFSISDNLDTEDDPSFQTTFRGFLNVGGIRGLNVDYGAFADLDPEGETEVTRDRIIAFHDDIDHVLRYSAGDLTPKQPRLGGAAELLGVSIERSYQDLRPMDSARPLGRRTFVLDRPGTIDVLVNGQLVRSFYAQPGPVELNDIPETGVANNVSVVVEDEFGRRELFNFGFATDASLLREGLSEFALAAGALRDQSGSQLSYGETVGLSAFYSRGMTSSLTLSAHAFAAENLVNAGAIVAVGSRRGVSVVEVATSSADGEDGIAAGVSYRGSPFELESGPVSLDARIDYQTRRFSRAGAFTFDNEREWDAAATLNLPLTRTLSLSAGGGIARRYDYGELDYSASLALSRRFGEFSVGVFAYHNHLAGGDDSSGATFTISRRFGSRTFGSAGYQTRGQRARAEVRRLRRDELGDFGYSLRLDSDQENDSEPEVSGAVSYQANRATAFLEMRRQSTGLQQAPQTIATARVQTGLAFADGRLGIGRDPGAGFYLVRQHKSLEGARTDVALGGGQRAMARTGVLGPAVLGIRGEYRPESVLLSVNDAPAGYFVGEGRHVAVPGARSGYDIRVGSDAFYNVSVTLTRVGEPFALQAGVVTNLETGAQFGVFTNRTGRVVFGGIAPGRYRAEFADANIVFEFEVNERDPAYQELGEREVRSQ